MNAQVCPFVPRKVETFWLEVVFLFYFLIAANGMDQSVGKSLPQLLSHRLHVSFQLMCLYLI